jgi:hypothetical protein
MNSRALVTPKIAEHLTKLLGMLGSEHDGEVLNAGRFADQFVRQLGLQWSDIIVAPPEWQAMALLCRRQVHLLSPKEQEFVLSTVRWRRHPTDKQLHWLQAIYERLGGRA